MMLQGSAEKQVTKPNKNRFKPQCQQREIRGIVFKTLQAIQGVLYIFSQSSSLLWLGRSRLYTAHAKVKLTKAWGLAFATP